MSVDLNTLAAAKILGMAPPRNEPKVKLRVVSRTHNHVICGVLLGAGEQMVDVYESDVQLFESAVERADMSQTKARVARYESALADKRSGKPIADTSLPRYPLSTEAVFREIEGRDMLPLLRVDRIDDRQPQKGR